MKYKLFCFQLYSLIYILSNSTSFLDMLIKLNMSREKQLYLNHLNILFVIYSNFCFRCKKMSDTSGKMFDYQNFEFYLGELLTFYTSRIRLLQVNETTRKETKA